MDTTSGPSSIGGFTKSLGIPMKNTVKSGSQRPFSKKPWPSNKARRKMTLGDDLGLEEATHLALNALVGRYSYRRRCSTPLYTRVKSHWLPVVGYIPEVYYLPRGWFVFIFHSPKDVDKILTGLWPFDGGRIMLK